MIFSPSSRAALVAFGLSISGAAFAQTAPKAAPPVPPPTKPAAPKPAPKIILPANVAARVGTQDITRDDVLAYVNLTRGRGLTDQVVLANLLQQEAKAQNVSVTEAELQDEIKKVRDRVVQTAMMRGGTPRTFDEIAAEEGFTDEYIRWNVYMDLLRRKVLTRMVSKEIPPMDNQMRLAHILVANIALPTSVDEQPKALTPEELKKKDEDAKAKIESVLADIKAGKISFEEAAGKYSDDKSNAPKGGDLGFLPPGRLDPAFEQAGFSIKNVGDIVGPVKSQFGYHLIKLLARGKDAPAAEKAAYTQRMINEIINNQQSQQRLIENLRTKRPITVNRAVVLVPNAKPLIPAKLPPGTPAKAPTKAASKTK
jgi:parvulin-like peptidyl-prolyl isomerase